MSVRRVWLQTGGSSAGVVAATRGQCLYTPERKQKDRRLMHIIGLNWRASLHVILSCSLGSNKVVIYREVAVI